MVLPIGFIALHHESRDARIFRENADDERQSEKERSFHGYREYNPVKSTCLTTFC
jgi:hypothetical protein